MSRRNEREELREARETIEELTRILQQSNNKLLFVIDSVDSKFKQYLDFKPLESKLIRRTRKRPPQIEVDETEDKKIKASPYFMDMIAINEE